MASSILQTARLTLRQMTDDDAGHILRLSRVPSIIANTGDPALATIDDALSILRTRIYPQYAHGMGRWAVVHTESGAFIGWCGAKLQDGGECDLAFRLFEEHQRMGYATEAAEAVVAWVRAHRPSLRIVATVAVHNASSIRVLTKLGMQLRRYDVDDDGPIAVFAMP